MRDALRAFAQAELPPHGAAWDRGHVFPRDALKVLGELGAPGVVAPETWGSAGLDYLSLAVALEDIVARAVGMARSRAARCWRIVPQGGVIGRALAG